MITDKERFVVVPFDLLDGNSYRQMVILSDWKYWIEYEDELQEWCDIHGASLIGMTITMDAKTLTAFYLRWR